MDTQGVILTVNEAFTIRFGYSETDLAGKNFAVLFTPEDRAISKPDTERINALATGSANDENYLVHKNGNRVWVTGESVLITSDAGERYIVKVVHNIHAQKQLERFLVESHEFIDSVFDSIDESALLLLDSRLRVIKVNRAFAEQFELQEMPEEGTRLSDIKNPFWQRADVKQAAIAFLTTPNSGEKHVFRMDGYKSSFRQLSCQGRLIEGLPGTEKKLLIMLKPA